MKISSQELSSTLNEEIEKALKLDSGSSFWDALDKKISNVSDPVADGDAVNKKYLDDNTSRKTFINVLDFGADNTGSSDSTAAIQAAINYLPIYGGTVYLPGGAYKISSAITISNISSVTICGDGSQSTHILLQTPTQDGFVVTSESPPCFRDLWIDSPQAKTAGAAIKIDTGSSAVNYRPIFENCLISWQYRAIDFVRAASWRVSNCEFTQYQNAAIVIKNLPNEDAGDSGVINCSFAGASTGIGILQYSSGGLRLIGNKFNTGSYGYQLALDLQSIPATSVLIVVGNSFENMSIGSLCLYKSGSGTFSHVVITGNEFALSPLHIDMGSGNWLQDVVITGNTFNVGSSGGSAVNISSGSGIVIDGNNFYGTGGTSFGLNINSSASNIKVGTNNFTGVTNPINNGSATCSIAGVTISGFISITTNTSYSGGLYYGTGNISIPAGIFKNAPGVALTPYGTGSWTFINACIGSHIPVSGNLDVVAIGTANNTELLVEYVITGF